MTAAVLKDLTGKTIGQVKLEESIFGIKPNTHLLHAALVRQLANARSGSANTKTRAEVRGGGRKPWRQKGTGRARAGSIRSPLWEGGGVIFGPKPRDFSHSLPKKARALALRSALSARAANLIVVPDFSALAEAKTKQMAAILQSLEIGGRRTLMVLDALEPASQIARRSARNIKGVRIINVDDLNVKDLLACEVILTTASAIEKIAKRLGQPKKAAGVKVSAGSRTTGRRKSKAEKAPPAADSPRPAESQ